jgi:hypothetical protein
VLGTSRESTFVLGTNTYPYPTNGQKGRAL